MDETAKSEFILKDAQVILSTLISAIPNPAFFRNASGVFVECNTAFAETILGATCEDILGQTASDLSEIIPRPLCVIL
jgi:PAS domain-containing protein